MIFLGFRLKCRGALKISHPFEKRRVKDGCERRALDDSSSKCWWNTFGRVDIEFACFFISSRVVFERAWISFFVSVLFRFLPLSWRAFEVLDATIWPHAQNVFLLLLFCSHAIITHTFSSFSSPNNQNRKEQRKSNLGHRPFTRRMTSKSRSSRKPSRKRRTNRSG